MRPYKTKFNNYDEFILEVIKNGVKTCLGTAQVVYYITVDEYFKYTMTLEFKDESTLKIKGDDAEEVEDCLPNFFGYVYLVFHYDIENKYVWFEIEHQERV